MSEDVEQGAGKRRADYTISKCQCKIPIPIQTTEYGNGEPAQYSCTSCGHALNGDSNDAPFRRWPNDLITGEVAEAKFALGEKAEIRLLIEQLPLFEQRRLRNLSGRAWLLAARRAIGNRMQEIKRRQVSMSVDTKPNRRRPTSVEIQ